MKKINLSKLKFAAVMLLLNLIGSAPGRAQVQAPHQEGPWTEVGYNTASTTNTIFSRAYKDLDNTYPSVWTKWHQWSNGDTDGYGFTAGPGCTKDYNGFVYAILKNTQSNVEAYSRKTFTWSWKLRWYNGPTKSTNPYVYNYLYSCNNLDCAQNVSIDFNNPTSLSNSGVKYLGGARKDEIGNQEVEATSDFTYDNSTGNASTNVTMYILVASMTGYTSSDRTIERHWWMATFKSQSQMVLKSTSYFKHITFEPNGGTGTAMDQQTIENSGMLNHNTYIRDGYIFDGWNTQADGSGTAYSNEGTISASSTDKGPVTLYAQWKPTAWSYSGQIKIGTILIAETANGLSYDSHNPTESWGGYYSTYVHETGDQGVKHNGNSTLGTSQVSISIYKQTKNIPAYSKFTRKASFAMYAGTNWAWIGCGLYMFDDESSAQSTVLDVQQDQTKTFGDAYKIVKGSTTDQTGTHHSFTGSKTITYDNSTGSSDKDISKYIDLVHSSLGNAGSTAYTTPWVTWKETSSTNESWSYYKYVTFDPNGGTGTAMAQQTVVDYSTAPMVHNLTKNTYTRTGYRFVGWNTEADGSGTAYNDEGAIGASSTDKGPVTLYAQWIQDWVEDKFYQATFTYGTVGYKSPNDLDPTLTPGNDYSNAWGMHTLFANDHHEIYGKGTATSGKMSVSMATYYYSKSIPSYSKLVRNVVFDFMMGNNSQLHGCGLYVGDDYDVLKEATFDAQADQSGKGTEHGIDYLLYKTYNTAGNGNYNKKSDSKSLAYDNKSGSTDKTLTKYAVFVHSVGNKGTNSTYYNVTHWAGWNEDIAQTTETWYYYKYITFNANEGTGTAMAQQEIENSGTLTPNTYTRDGYVFVGWNTQADGNGTAYTNCGVIEASSEDKGPVTLYAQWEASEWSYAGQIKMGAMPIDNTEKGLSFNNHNPEQSWGGYYATYLRGNGVTGDQGHMHKGTSIDNTSQVSISIYKQTKHIPAYSKFTRNASFTMYAKSDWSWQGFGLYVFDDESTAKSTVLDVRQQQDKDYGKDYKIVTGSMSDLNTIRSFSGSKDITYDNSTGSSDKDITKYIDFVHSSLGHISETIKSTQWATWKETNSSSESWSYYKYFTFNANEGTGTAMAKQEIENSGNLTLNTYTHTGYTFAGWNTQADGKGTAYTDGQAITATLEDKGEVTLYAQWTPNKYTITYNAGEGTCTEASKEVTYDATYGDLAVPTRAAYKFDGWFTEETGGEKVESTTTVTITENKTLYAHWTAQMTIGGEVVTNFEIVTLTDGKNLVINGSVAVDSISYTRSMNNAWGTICLPFALVSNKKVQYYKLAEVADETMTFEFVESVPANTPAVFRRLNQKEDYKASARQATLSAELKSGVSDSEDWKLTGTFTSVTLNHEDSTKYYIANNQFWQATQATEDITIPAYRAYFTYTSPTPQEAKPTFFNIAIAGDPTVIGSLDTETGELNIMTDGKYLENGNVIIIKNGKKYNVKGQKIK